MVGPQRRDEWHSPGPARRREDAIDASVPHPLLMLQTLAGNEAVADLLGDRNQRVARPVLQAFGSEEHEQLGDEASGNAHVDLDIGDPANPLTQGDIVALSGDYFGSPGEIMTLAQSDDGKAQLRWARYSSMHRGNPGTISDQVKNEVKDRYYKLAAANISHFSAGGTARSEYERLHMEAQQEAFMAAATGDRQMALTGQVTEGFSEHHLTDMFSSGHVRTPRADIKGWYEENIPGSVDRFVDYTAAWITAKLDDYDDIPWWCPNSKIRSGIRDKIRQLGGSAVDSFSLGDIVSLALHDRENALGLWVTSDVDPSGVPVMGGFHWPEKDMGDGHLHEAPLTRQMAEAAVRVSLDEVRAASRAGAAATANQCLTPEALENTLNEFLAVQVGGPQALGYVPRADDERSPATGWRGGENQAYISGPQAEAEPDQLDYRWGGLDRITYAAVDSEVKDFIAATLRSMSASVGGPDGMVHEADITDWLPGLGPEMAGGRLTLIDLHVRKAFEEYCDYLAAEGIHVVEKAMGRVAQGGHWGGGHGVDAGAP